MSKYRFKTEEEFKKEGRWSGERPKSWVTVMNKYLGKDIPDRYNAICDEKEQLHYETWSFNPKDYVLKESSFVLPEKWCIKVTEENIDTLGIWRSAGPLPDRSYAEKSWYLHTPKYDAKGYNEDQNAPKELTRKDLVKGEIYIYDGSQIAIYPEGPSVDFNGHYIPIPKWLWTLPITHATEEQKALLRSCIKKHEKVEPIPQLWLEDPIVEEKISIPSIKKETFIDNVQSVDVMLRTKRKSIKF